MPIKKNSTFPSSRFDAHAIGLPLGYATFFLLPSPLSTINLMAEKQFP